VAAKKAMEQGVDTGLHGAKLTDAQQQLMDTLPQKMMVVMREEMTREKLRPGYVQLYKETLSEIKAANPTSNAN
jgi:hypothetical protein